MNLTKISRRAVTSGILLTSASLPMRGAIGAGAAGPLRHGRGGIPPIDLVARIKRQSAIADQATSFLRTLPGATPPPVFQPSLTRANWHEKGKVTSIKDQGQCGSCWDFAALAAYESSYLIANNITLDLAEQMQLDCNSRGYDCGGGWPDSVMNDLSSKGEVTEQAYPVPYTLPNPAKSVSCPAVSPIPYRAVTWGYVGGLSVLVDDDATLQLPANEILKQALCDHGPIAVGVSSAGWDPYTGGVFHGQPSVTNLTHPSSDQIDHVVLLMGWDNGLDNGVGAWLIKNSWGTSWGDKGFMQLAYNTANLGFAGVWVRSPTAHMFQDAHALNTLQAINLGLLND